MTIVNLQPRHANALKLALATATAQGNKLQVRYLREVLRELGLVEKPAVKKGRKAVDVFMRPLKPSKALAAIVGERAQPRTEIVAKLWTYIKKNKLQDNVNKRMVNNDAKLKAIFGNVAQTSMFEMAGLITKHVK